MRSGPTLPSFVTPGSRLWETLLLAFTIGCGADDHAGPGFTVRDSAGIEIVESVEPRWPRGEGWTLSEEPEIAIGIAQGDEAYLLSDVYGARWLADGRIAVLDGGSSSVRLYGPDGRHIRDLGGPGEGPGELQRPQHMIVLADTIIVYEYFPSSLSWYEAGGPFLGTIKATAVPDEGLPRAMMIGLLEERWVVALGIPGGREFVEGVNRVPTPVWRLGLRSGEIDFLMEVPGFEELIDFPRPGVTRHRPHLFGKETLLAAAGDRFFVAPTDRYSIRIHNATGEFHRIIRRVTEPRTTTPDDVERYIEQSIASRGLAPEDQVRFRESLRDASVAEEMPAYRWIVPDGEGNLWVEEWEDVGLGQGPFSVFGPDGAWLGTVEVPDGLTPMRGRLFQPWVEIGADYFLGVWVDELGVEQVRLYRIRKGAAGT